MKILSKQRRNYLIYLVSVTILILILFNTLITFRIHKQLAQVASTPGHWPAGAYIYDEKIGFDFAPNVSGYISDGSFYVKSHSLGYRISQNGDANNFKPGGLLSLGCSFTYGDEVESGQTFTQLAADSLGIPAYNYGICSFSYTHALLKAEELKATGVLDKLQPEYVVLGCWSGLPDRSRSPVPPLASRNLPLPAAYITKDGGDVGIQFPLKTQNIFEMLEIYRKEGTGLSFKKFVKIFFAVPGYINIFIKSKRLSQQIKSRTFQNDASDFEIYDFYFSGIEKVFSGSSAQIIVLYMPNRQGEQPGAALMSSLAAHPGIIFVDGLQAIKKYGVPVHDYQGRHPQPAAHRAYAQEIVDAVKGK